MISYLTGIMGMWLVCDGLISIRIYYNKLAETGGRKQNWKYDHSIRVIRILIGLILIAFGLIELG